MNPIATQQAALDNALVPFEKRLKIERCNARIAFGKPQKEETYQITLDALKLSPCYPAFHIIVEVPEIYMHQFWNTIKKIGKTDDYNFKLDKKKCRVDIEVFCEILQICPRIPNQDFVELPSEEDLLTFIKELGYSGKCTLKFVSKTEDYQKKVPSKKGRKFKKPASPKLKIVLVSPKEPTQKGKRVKRLTKKATTSSTTGVVIRDTPDKFVSKKKAPTKADRGDSKDESDDVHDEDGNYDDNGNDDDSGNDDDGSNDAEDSEQTDSDDDKNPSFLLKEYEEEENEEYMYEEEDDDVAKELYGDLNITQGLRDTDMTKVEQESLGAKVLVRSTNQPHTSYAVAASLSELGLKKILIDKMETNESINKSDIQRNLYNALVESYNTNKDILSTYGDVVTLKIGRDDQDKDGDPFARLNRGTKRRKSNKYDQGNESGHIDDQPNSEAAPKHDWFQKPDKPPTPDSAWNKSKTVDFRPPQRWINTIAKECYKERQHPRTFDELMGTPINFSDYVMNCLKIDNLTQEILVGLAFNLLKSTCKSFTELEYHFEECYKAVNDRLDWHNPKRRKYPFDISKPLLLIKDRGRQVVPVDYFINNDLEYLKGGSSSSKYVTSTTRTTAAKFYSYACHWKSPHDVYSKRRIITVTSVKVIRWYDYGYLEEIVVQRDDNLLYKFKEGDFPRLNLRDIKDMLLLLVQKKLSNLNVDDRYDLGVALRMFTRHIVILHRVEDLQLGVESYQKQVNITRPDKFRSDIPNMIPYTAYKNPQGIIYQDKFQRNRPMHSDKLYMFYDGTLSSVRKAA
nr:hypothetical protein [Tanacetum cinerariifolium]